MQSIFSNALSRAVAKHIGLSATRRETLSWLALLIMQHGTISLWRLAAYVASAAQTASVQRRFYRFFQFVRLDGTHSARVVVDLLGLSGKRWVLAIDRTNWDFGKTTINILVWSVLCQALNTLFFWPIPIGCVAPCERASGSAVTSAALGARCGHLHALVSGQRQNQRVITPQFHHAQQSTASI
jgi:hypothetical protein